jgi:flagellar biosynthesis protein FlhA
VIGAIGAYVVGGNAVVGLVVFAILIVVQYVVVTNGAQRVSEVAARFTLDSMPGQQMSIDADLNMGFIDQAEAQRRRRKPGERSRVLRRDGRRVASSSRAMRSPASSILLINIVGGLVIGVMQHQLPWAQALQTYTLLTVGDGIVTQVPALVIAVGTGIIVTRSASDGNLSREALRQVTVLSRRRCCWSPARWAACCCCRAFRQAARLGLAAMALAVAAIASRLARAPKATRHRASQQAPSQDGEQEPGRTGHRTDRGAVGSRWAGAGHRRGQLFLERIAALRKQHAQDVGLVLPRVRFRAAPNLAPDAYEIHLDGAVVARGEARQDRVLAIHPAGDQRSIAG